MLNLGEEPTPEVVSALEEAIHELGKSSLRLKKRRRRRRRSGEIALPLAIGNSRSIGRVMNASST
jgi:hypothetical protein